MGWFVKIGQLVLIENPFFSRKIGKMAMNVTSYLEAPKNFNETSFNHLENDMV